MVQSLCLLYKLFLSQNMSYLENPPLTTASLLAASKNHSPYELVRLTILFLAASNLTLMGSFHLLTALLHKCSKAHRGMIGAYLTV